MSGWIEPTRALPLRWGTYTGRYLAGLGLIVSGAIAVQGGNPHFEAPLVLGILAHVVGWWIMPAAGWRRIWVVLPSLLCVLILLIGPAGVGVLAVPFMGWLLVRHRPLPTFALALVVLGVGALMREFFAEYSGMLPALGIIVGLIVASAWIARLAASSRLFHRHSR